MRLYLMDNSLVFLTKRKKEVMLELTI